MHVLSLHASTDQHARWELLDHDVCVRQAIVDSTVKSVSIVHVSPHASYTNRSSKSNMNAIINQPCLRKFALITCVSEFYIRIYAIQLHNMTVLIGFQTSVRSWDVSMVHNACSEREKLTVVVSLAMKANSAKIVGIIHMCMCLSNFLPTRTDPFNPIVVYVKSCI